MRNFLQTVFTLAFAIMLPNLVSQVRAADKKVKVFVLAGQSNMEGHGDMRSLPVLGEHPKYGYLLKMLQNKDGSWVIRDDVTIAWKAKEKKHGPLTVGWGCEENEIGPELMFGTIMGEMYDAPVLLIKTAWGGKDVYCDFRSPSAGKPTGAAAALLKSQREEGGDREIGQYYRLMVEDVRETLNHIKDIVPDYQGQGYEMAGFVWFQGWNDFCGGFDIIEQYAKHLSAMFRDVRKDLNAPDMPIVIGELGIGGNEIAEKAKKYEDDFEANGIVNFRAAQKAVGDDESLKNVTFVPTADFWDTRLQDLREISNAYWDEKQKKGIKDTEENHLPTKEQNDEFLRRGVNWYCHYNGSSANYSLVGYALAQALNTGSGPASTSEDIVIADFEGKDYGDWAVTGNAFGNAPVKGTQASRHTVRGFMGKGLIDTYVDPTGKFYEPGKHWVMAVYDHTDELGNAIAIYNSKDMKHWELKNKIPGYYECAEIFELPVDNVEEGRLQDAPLKPVDGEITIRVLVDRPIMEIIGNNGSVYITRPREKKGQVETIEAFASGGTAQGVKIEVNELESIWKK